MALLNVLQILHLFGIVAFDEPNAVPVAFQDTLHCIGGGVLVRNVVKRHLRPPSHLLEYIAGVNSKQN